MTASREADPAGLAMDGPRLGLLLATGVALFSANQAVGVAFPVHVTERLGGSAAAVGTIGAVAISGALIGRAVAGRLADRLGRRRSYASGALVMAGACAGYAAVETLGLTALLRTLHLLTFAVATSVYVIAATEGGPVAGVGRRLGLAQGVMHLSLLGSPVIAIEVLDSDLARIGPLAAALLCLCVLGGLIVLGPGRGRGRAEAVAGSSASTLVAVVPGVPSAGPFPVRAVRPRLGLAAALIAAGVVGLSDGVAMEYVPLLGLDRGISQYAVFYPAFAVSALVVLVSSGRLLRGSPAARLGALSLGFLALGFVLLAIAGAASTLSVAGIAVGLGFGLAQLSVGLLFARRWGGRSRGRNVAQFLLGIDVGRAVGVLVAGHLIDRWGFGVTMLAVAGVVAGTLFVVRAAVGPDWQLH